MPTQAERRRNRNLATTLVSVAIMLMGVAFIVFALGLTFQSGGVGGFFIGMVLGAFGILLLASGFFFQLVPLRVHALAEEKREYDARVRSDAASEGADEDET